MTNNFRFSGRSRRLFLLKYVVAKTLLLWSDVRYPRFRLFLYEMVYSLYRAVGRPPLSLRWLRLDRVTTRFGTFATRPGTIDAACVSPAFERPDLDHLIGELRKRLEAGRRVTFVDVGADIGTYAISVVNSLQAFGEIRGIAFEPSRSSFALLQRNLRDNGLDELVEARPLALGDGSVTSASLMFDPREPGSSGLNASLVHGDQAEKVRVSTLDAELRGRATLDVLAMKLDVEGSETAVLQGAEWVIGVANEVLLLVEDFVDEKVVDYLTQSDWSFDTKHTPYNSFWSRGKQLPSRLIPHRDRR